VAGAYVLCDENATASTEKPTSIGDEMNLLEKPIKKPLKGRVG